MLYLFECVHKGDKGLKWKHFCKMQWTLRKSLVLQIPKSTNNHVWRYNTEKRAEIAWMAKYVGMEPTDVAGPLYYFSVFL